MIAPLPKRRREPARPLLPGPRFALRFEDGRGLLVLAKPLRFAFGTVEALELSLGALRFPLDLSAGAARFRTHRTVLRRARARLDVSAWIAAREPYRLVPLSAREGAWTFALTDPFGTVAFDAHVRIEGADLWIAIASARSVGEGPAPPLARVLAAARAFGLQLDEPRGALRAPRFARGVWMEALVPNGWRVPDDRGARFAIEALGRGRVLLRTLDVGEAEAAVDGEPFERARRLAPIVSALTRGDRAGAVREWAALRERLGAVGPELSREAASLGVADLEAGGRDPLSLSVALRAALRRGDAGEALAIAPALAAVEPCDALAVEALCAAADLALSGRRAAEAAALLERASARRPRDGRVALRLIEVLAASGGDALERAIESALLSREPGAERGELAREAATVCELAGRHGAAARLWRAAADHLPHDARVLEGLAGAEARAGRSEEARALWDRAFEARAAAGEEDAAARALRQAARLAEHGGRLDVAEERLARATELVPSDPEAWAALARVRRAAGARAGAGRAEDRLLELAPGAASREVADALAGAAAWALEEGDLERARAFTIALARAAPDHDARGALEARVEAVDRERHGDPVRGAVPTVPVPAPMEAGPPEDGVAPEHGALDVRAESVDRAAVPQGDFAREVATEPAPAPVEAAVTEAGAALIEKARAAASARDTAALRAALRAAERAGELEAARAIVDLALGAVGEGPARRALLAARERLR